MAVLRELTDERGRGALAVVRLACVRAPRLRPCGDYSAAAATRRRGWSVLWYAAVLHDHEDVVRILEQREIRQRIAVDHDEIGEIAFPDLAHVGNAGPLCVGVGVKLAAELRGGVQHLGRSEVEVVDEVLEVPRVRPVRDPGEGIVAERQDAHAARVQLLDRLADDGEFVVVPERDLALRRHAEFRGLIGRVVGDADRRYDEDFVLGLHQHVDGLVIGVGCVVDDVDPVFEAEPDRFRSPRVGADAPVPLPGDLADRRHLVFGHDGRVAPAVGVNELVARRHDLEDIHALAAQHPRRLTELLRAVADDRECPVIHVELARIAQAAGDGQLRRGRQHARARDPAGGDLVADHDVHAGLARRGADQGR